MYCDCKIFYVSDVRCVMCMIEKEKGKSSPGFKGWNKSNKSSNLLRLSWYHLRYEKNKLFFLDDSTSTKLEKGDRWLFAKLS